MNNISFIGVQFPLSNSLYGYFTPSYNSYLHLKSKIINLLLTLKNLRIIGNNLLFGMLLNSLIFLQDTSTYKLTVIRYIIEKINTFIPEVNILEIKTEFDENIYVLTVHMTYKLKNDLTGLGLSITLSYKLGE